MFRKNVLLIVGLMLMASPLAAKKAEEKVVVADTSEKFELLVEAIRQEMTPGKRYEFLSSGDRVTVNQALDRMSAMLGKSGSVSALNDRERTTLFNEQEKVNGLLARNADDRLVCTYVSPVGSHLPVKSCKTTREIAQDRANSRRQADEFSNQGRTGSGPGN